MVAGVGPEMTAKVGVAAGTGVDCNLGASLGWVGGGVSWSKFTRWYCSPHILLYDFPHSITGHVYGGLLDVRSLRQKSNTSKSNPI